MARREIAAPKGSPRPRTVEERSDNEWGAKVSSVEMSIGLDRVRHGGKTEVARLERWHDRGREPRGIGISIGSENEHRLAQLFQLVQHEQWRLGKPKVFHRLHDLAILDEPESIAGEPGRQQTRIAQAADP